jgi:hypothetical protein
MVPGITTVTLVLPDVPQLLLTAAENVVVVDGAAAPPKL